MLQKYLFTVFVLLMVVKTIAQDTVTDTLLSTTTPLKFTYKQLLIPGILIGYGIIGIESDQIKDFNDQIKKEINEHIDQKITVDDFSQYAPAVSVYVLNAFGVKGKNNLRDRSVIFATSYLIMSATILTIKSNTKVLRPDGSSYNSFPSGHTATAFAGAEFLYQEYKDQSIWYGIAGYVVATSTGIFRIYNDRHWLTDVAAGAGIGILSTKIAYWINPYLTRKLFKSTESNTSSIFAPFYNGQQYGLSFVKLF